MKYPEKIVAGLMSGTSLDGLDIAICRFNGQDEEFSYQILDAVSEGYPADMKKRLSGLMEASAYDFASEHFRFGYYSGFAVKNLLDSKKLKVDFISSHGHTVFHQPEKGFTFQ